MSLPLPPAPPLLPPLYSFVRFISCPQFPLKFHFSSLSTHPTAAPRMSLAHKGVRACISQTLPAFHHLFLTALGSMTVEASRNFCMEHGVFSVEELKTSPCTETRFSHSCHLGGKISLVSSDTCSPSGT